MRILDFADGFASNVEPSLISFPALSVSLVPIAGLDAINLQEAMAEHQTDIEALDARLDTAESDIGAVETRVGDAELDILNLENATSNLDNTSDANKPVSTATQTALNLKVDQTDFTAHTGSSTAHASSSITYDNTISGLTASNAKTAIDELKSEIDALSLGNDASIGTTVQGLKISHVSSSSNHVIFDSIVLEDTSGNKIRHGYNLITTTLSGGPNGLNRLDTGSKANSTWYYIYVISNGTTVGALYSTQLTGTQGQTNEPTMPSGYTYRKCVGAVRTNSSGNMPETLQVGHTVMYASLQAAIETTTNDATTQSVDCQAFIPPYIAWELQVYSMLTAVYSTNTNASLLIQAGPAFGGTPTPPIVGANIANTASTSRIGAVNWFHVFNESPSECRYRVRYSSTSTNRTSFEYGGYVLGYRVICL